MDEVPVEIKLQIINQERQMWMNTREQMTIRYRVNKRLDSKDGMKAVETELEHCEMALDELDKIIAEITASGAEEVKE